MKIKIRFDAFDLTKAIFTAAAESLPSDASHADEQALIPARESRYLEALAPWLDNPGQNQVTIEFDTEAGSARVLRRDERSGAGAREARLRMGGPLPSAESPCECVGCGASAILGGRFCERCAALKCSPRASQCRRPSVPDDVLQRAAALAVGLPGSWFEPVKGEPEGGAE